MLKAGDDWGHRGKIDVLVSPVQRPESKDGSTNNVWIVIFQCLDEQRDDPHWNFFARKVTDLLQGGNTHTSVFGSGIFAQQFPSSLRIAIDFHPNRDINWPPSGVLVAGDRLLERIQSLLKLPRFI